MGGFVNIQSTRVHGIYTCYRLLMPIINILQCVTTSGIYTRRAGEIVSYLATDIKFN